MTVAQVRNYLNRLGVGLVGGETVDLRTALPLNVAGRYDAARAEIADEKCIILFPRNEEMALGDIALHNDSVRNVISVRPVFAFSRLDREFAESLKAAKSRMSSHRGKCSCRPARYWNQAAHMQTTRSLSGHTLPRGHKLSCSTASCTNACQELCGFQRFADA